MSIWSHKRNTAMKVFSQLFVGVQKSQSQSVPLGFATPYEDTAAGRKRQETVINWLGGRTAPVVENNMYKCDADGQIIRVPVNLDLRTIANDPAQGFKITDDVKRVYWGGGNVVWRVEDPRGFELEIQSNNLMAIIQSCGINEGGLIPGNCIWGRSGGDNILLHESSEEYKDSVKAAETLKAPKQIGKASRRIGGIYRRVDGTPAIYLGKVHVTKVIYESENDSGRYSVRVNLLETNTILQSTAYRITPSEPFEAMLEFANYGSTELGNNLVLYKKAPCVDDLGDVELPVLSDEYFQTLKWKFASTGISACWISSVTMNPILKPIAIPVPWTKTKYDKVLDALNRYVKSYCHGVHRYRLPMVNLLPDEKDVLVLGSETYGAIATLGRPHGADNRQTQPSFEIALKITFTPGEIVALSGTNYCANALDIQRYGYTAYQSSSSITSWNSNNGVPTMRLPQFEDEVKFFEYIEQLYTNGQLCYITIKDHEENLNAQNNSATS